MTVQNSLAARNEKPKFSVAIQSDGYKKMINNTLGDPKVAQRFIAAVTSAVSANPDLQECEPSTILSAALLGESLKLSPSPVLGNFYMVPFNDYKNKRTVATFILGYKGYIQLAIRSGYYRKLNVLPIKEGELVNFDPLNETIESMIIEDEEAREKAETIGYYAMFEYMNGFRKAMYWSKAKMESHAIKFSKGYAAKKGYTFWEKDFDSMACKTMLRQLISKWGIMSIELQQAYERDETFADDNGKYEYANELEVEVEREAPKSRKNTKKDDPLAGTPFEAGGTEEIPFSDDAPDFVNDVEEE